MHGLSRFLARGLSLDVYPVVANLQIEALTALVERVKALELQARIEEREVKLQARIEERGKEIKQEITELKN